MIIDLLGGSYDNKYKDFNAQRTVNWYPVKADQQEKDKTQLVLFPRPGLKQFCNLGNDPVRGLFTAISLTQDRCFAVTGTTLWEISYDGSVTSWGALTGFATGSNSKVYMAMNGLDQLMIQDTLAAYIFNLDTNTLTAVTSIDYNRGTTLDYADGYFVVSGVDGMVHFSDLNDGLTWPGFNFFAATFKPDSVRAVVASREEIYCFGDTTIEVYINDGVAPFIRLPRTSMYYGLTARDSIAVHQAGVFFLGKTPTGGNDVYMMGQNYSVTPISTPAISQKLNAAGENADAEGTVVSTTDGHIFYYLHLPALHTTLVYDVTTGMWHERQSQRPYKDADGSIVQDMYRGRNYATFRGIGLYGDWYSGKIFKESGTTDDSLIRVLKRISPVFQNELKYVSIYRLEIDINAGFGATTGQGSAPMMMLSTSTDGGNTFNNEQLMDMGALGQYDWRIQTNNLGTARNWVISFEVSDPVDIIVMQAVVNGAMGTF